MPCRSLQPCIATTLTGPRVSLLSSVTGTSDAVFWARDHLTMLSSHLAQPSWHHRWNHVYEEYRSCPRWQSFTPPPLAAARESLLFGPFLSDFSTPQEDSHTTSFLHTQFQTKDILLASCVSLFCHRRILTIRSFC